MVFAGFNWFLIIVTAVSTCQPAGLTQQCSCWLYTASQTQLCSTHLLQHASTLRKLQPAPVLAAFVAQSALCSCAHRIALTSDLQTRQAERHRRRALPRCRGCLLLLQVIALLALGVGLYLLIIYCHPEDRNQAWFPKAVVVFGIALAIWTVLLFPLDVANRKVRPKRSFSKKHLLGLLPACAGACAM